MELPHTNLTPEIGKTYYAYDDGKLSPSREFQVKITKSFDLEKDDLLTFNDEFDRYADDDDIPFIDKFRDELNHYYWLLSPVQSVVYYGECTDEKYKDMSQWFVKTVDDRWFGVCNYCSALLDLTGEYHKLCWGEY